MEIHPLHLKIMFVLTPSSLHPTEKKDGLMTPLMVAAHCGHRDSVRHLLAAYELRPKERMRARYGSESSWLGAARPSAMDSNTATLAHRRASSSAQDRQIRCARVLDRGRRGFRRVRDRAPPRASTPPSRPSRATPPRCATAPSRTRAGGAEGDARRGPRPLAHVPSSSMSSFVMIFPADFPTTW